MANELSIPVVERAAAPATKPVTGEVSPAVPVPERLASLDAFRGFIMFWIIGGEGSWPDCRPWATIVSSTPLSTS